MTAAAPAPSAALARGFLGPPWKQMPNSAWCGTMAEARRWAAAAHEEYRKAVVLAAFEALTPENQAAFLAYVQKDGRRHED